MVCNYSDTIAIKYGINAALIAGYIREKLEKTELYGGDVSWERITIKTITGAFPFLGEKAVRNAIKRLKKRKHPHF